MCRGQCVEALPALCHCKLQSDRLMYGHAHLIHWFELHFLNRLVVKCRMRHLINCHPSSLHEFQFGDQVSLVVKMVFSQKINMNRQATLLLWALTLIQNSRMAPLSLWWCCLFWRKILTGATTLNEWKRN